MLATAELLNDVLAGTEREGQNRECRWFVRNVNEYAGVGDIQVSNIVSLTETIRDELFRIVPHAASSNFMLAIAGTFRLFGNEIHHPTSGVHDLRANLLRVLPHP